MDNYDFELELKVRDYECDLQGVVNNSVYQNYLEHTRHEYLQSVGLDFAALFNQGIVASVARIEMAFKYPLRSGDSFISCLNVELEGIKFMFYQNIYRRKDHKLCLKGKVTTVATINNRLGVPEEMKQAIAETIGKRQ